MTNQLSPIRHQSRQFQTAVLTPPPSKDKPAWIERLAQRNRDGIIEKLGSPRMEGNRRESLKDEYSPLFEAKASVEILPGQDIFARDVYSDSVKASKKKVFPKRREGTSGYDFDALVGGLDLSG